MLTRTERGKRADVYECSTREKKLGECSMGRAPRATVDAAAFAYLAEVGVDLEATHAALTAGVERLRRERTEALDRATRAELDAADAIERVKADYTGGRITAAEWHDLRDELEGARAQAAAQVEAARAAADEAEEAADSVGDLETVAVDRLAQIRQAVAGAVADQEGIEAARAALARIFRSFRIYGAEQLKVARQPDPAKGIEAEVEWEEHFGEVLDARARGLAAGEWLIVPVVRPEALAPIEDGWLRLNQEPLFSASEKGASST